MRNRTALVLALALVLCNGAFSARQVYSIAECGVHELEGYLKADEINPKAFALVVNNNTESQFTVHLGKYDPAKYQNALGTKVRLRIGIYETCLYDCGGNLVKLDFLNPWDHPRIFTKPFRPPIEKFACRSK